MRGVLGDVREPYVSIDVGRAARSLVPFWGVRGLGTVAAAVAQPCRSPAYRRSHPRECNKGSRGGGWPKCGDLCAFTEYRQAVPSACGGVHGLGTVVRDNPLPPGRYTKTLIDQPKGAIDSFLLWAQSGGGLVHLESTQELPATGSTPKGLFVIFTVKSPGVAWNPKLWGYPDSAGQNVQTIEDVEQSPEVADPFEDLLPKTELPVWVYLALGTVALVAISSMVGQVSTTARAFKAVEGH